MFVKNIIVGVDIFAVVTGCSYFSFFFLFVYFEREIGRQTDKSIFFAFFKLSSPIFHSFTMTLFTRTFSKLDFDIKTHSLIPLLPRLSIPH